MVMDAGPDNAGHDMDGQDTTGTGHADLPDARKLAQDWITLWQSELSAMAADPEIRESWQTIMALWAGTMSTLLRGLPRDMASDRANDGARGRAGPADAPRAASAAAAPDARDAEIDRLARHVAALEQQLAELSQRVERERGGDPAIHPRRRPATGAGRKPRQ